ncbi:MAG TPA: hypothetical protein VLJ83_10110 [Gemmatimonadaceae bacterium]|nr:hypothetical protein [Gemmatimonadaceae bacterium]
MRVGKLVFATGAAALISGFAAGSLRAQESANSRAPIIRIYSEGGSGSLATTNYVRPAIEVGENSYVFAVAMDLDGQIQVLHPDFPGISVKLVARRQVNLPNFFAGFSERSTGSYYSSVSYLGYDYNGSRVDTRGTIIALASRAPFNLERIEVGGDWNMSAIRRLIDNRTPAMAAQSLASYIGAKGEPIGRDYMRFAGGGDYYAYDQYDPCSASYGFAFAPLRRAQLFAQINYLASRGVRYRIAGYDLCGTPIVVPVFRNGNGQLPSTRPPRSPGDTTMFPKARFPHEGAGRHPKGVTTSAEGVFPLPPRSRLPQMGDVTVTAPTSRRGEPLEILQGYRTTPGGMAIPHGRVPVERPVAPRVVPSTSGAEPVRQYRPEPRVESPPPSRMPEAPRTSSPPPETHSAPPPPATRSEPARVPPPSRK